MPGKPKPDKSTRAKSPQNNADNNSRTPATPAPDPAAPAPDPAAPAPDPATPAAPAPAPANPAMTMPNLPPGLKPWAVVWSMLIGFFMLMIDGSIVSVANPTIQADLNTSLTATIWVTSAYMLAIAVPLLVAGRLGDRFGQKNVFMLGMAIFTLASLGCGLSNNITLLVVTRVIQGIGAALMTPQTTAMIVRIFPPVKRGAPMGVWGSVSGVAMLIGPLLGGFLVDHVGWQAIFLVNVPIGIIGLILVGIFAPKLSTARPKFDWLGMVISGIGLFLLVFGLQEGSTHDWGEIWGPITIGELIGAGIVLLVVFIIWEIKGTKNPLVPMRLFKHRDFSAASVAVMCMGFVVSSLPLPLLYFLQIGRGYSAVGSALFMLPSAIMAGILSPLVGAKLVHKLGSRVVAGSGFVIIALGLFWLSRVLTPTQVLVPWALFPAAVIGLGNACIWSPLSVSATQFLPHQEAGSGTGIYNMMRQIGAVIGSACIATLMNDRIAAGMSQPPFPQVPVQVLQQLPSSFSNVDLSQFAQLLASNATLAQWFTERFAPAMSQSLWLPIGAALLGSLIASLQSWKAGKRHQQEPAPVPTAKTQQQDQRAGASAKTH